MKVGVPSPLPGEPLVDIGENSRYLTDQLITCIGNKRALLPEIARAVDLVRERAGGRTLRTLDAFSGSGVVSRLLKSRSSIVYANDIEDYARVASECFLTNAVDVSWPDVDAALDHLRDVEARLDALEPGFIERLYAPACDEQIAPSERAFYTRRNARRLDHFRQALDRFEPLVRTLLLGPLLSEASIHANTAGVFKGFYKDRATGIGRFGGSGSDALTRITGPITPQRPVLSRFASDVRVLQMDANELPNHVGDLDLVYIDPPYNQHPYGSNYFMLNLLATYREPKSISRVSGIPADWRRSAYNVRSEAADRLATLVAELDARWLLVSYNSEGFIALEEMRALLAEAGWVTEHAISHPVFRGSRSFANRGTYVTEHLFLIERA